MSPLLTSDSYPDFIYLLEEKDDDVDGRNFDREQIEQEDYLHQAEIAIIFPEDR